MGGQNTKKSGIPINAFKRNHSLLFWFSTPFAGNSVPTKKKRKPGKKPSEGR
jgi:hypothetical protein